MVRAKFRVNRIERTQYMVQDGVNEASVPKYKNVEMQTVVMSPVYGYGDPNHENTKFWDATPTGEIKLGTINAEAAAEFELGKEYYIDFTRADETR